MKSADRTLQAWRMAKVRKYISPGDKILDIGSVDGALFRHLGPVVGPGSMGIDPTLKEPLVVNGFTLQAGFFPAAMPPSAGPFDVITMLAVLEHFPGSEYGSLRTGCETFLRPGGKLLITVPSPQVDMILKWLTFFRLIDGMSLEEHHGYEVGRTVKIFAPESFRLVKHGRFQLGLNNLFVFERLPVK
jgi:cyclopropane fatty-acyl-phospholipid synthase-like methyltransferase